ncbi:hypothetical protein ACG3SL_09035 [Sphingomonas sp. CJ20]
MNLRLLLLIAPLSMAAPSVMAEPAPLYGRLCGGGLPGRQPGDMPGKDPCAIACHGAPGERNRHKHGR